jgi:hypothetical protein
MSGSLDTAWLEGAISEDVEVNLPADAMKLSKQMESKNSKKAKPKVDLDKTRIQLEKELAAAQAKLKELESQDRASDVSSSLSLGRRPNPRAQEEKVLNAIKSERIEQDCAEPVIPKRKFRKKYGIHPTSLNKTIARMVSSGIIKETSVPYLGKVTTFKYMIL